MRRHRIERGEYGSDKIVHLNDLLDQGPDQEDRRCTKCPLWETSIVEYTDTNVGEGSIIARRSNISGRGEMDAPILLVGEAPGDHEVALDEVFVGPSGEFLTKALTELGIHKKCRITNTFRCKPPFLQVPNRIIYRPCLNKLADEIELVQPAAIGCLGATAFKEVCKMLGMKGDEYTLSEHIGSVLHPKVKVTYEYEHVHKRTGKITKKKKTRTEKGVPIVPMYHPAAYLRSDRHHPLNWMDRKCFTNGLRVVADKAGIEVESSLPDYEVARDFKAACELLDFLATEEHVSFDLETSPPDTADRRPYPVPWTDLVLCFSFAWAEGEAAVLPWRNQITEEGEPLEFTWDKRQRKVLVTKLKRILENRKILKSAHNGIGFDRPVLKYDPSLKIKVRNLLYDGMLLHHIWDQERPHGLKDLSFLYTDLGNYEAPLDAAKAELPKGATYALLPEDLLYTYAAADADAEFRIIEFLLKKIREFDSFQEDRLTGLGMEGFYYEHTRRVALLASSMEETGAPVSVERVKELQEKFESEISEKREMLENLPEVKEMLKRLNAEKRKKKEKEFAARFKELKKPRHATVEEYVASRMKSFKDVEFNPGSPIQMPKLLFEVCELPILRHTSKGAPETGRKAMDLYEHPITDALKDIRQIEAYHRWLQQQILDHVRNGRVHTSYLIIGTDTGRWSSQRPNLQNIPSRGKRAKEMASVFVAPPGYCFIKADFGQAEFRLFAIYSGDEVMIQDIIDGLDVHTFMASEAYGVTLEEVIADKDAGGEMRAKAKNGVFLTIYGGSPSRLAYELRIDIEVAERLQEAFWGRYPQAEQWVEDIRFFARRNEFTRSLFGRANTFQGIARASGGQRAKLERKASNSIIQGTASDLTCKKGILLRRAFREEGLKDAKVCLQIHDALVSLVPLEGWRETYDLHRRVMEAPHDRITEVPMPIDQEIGLNLGELYEEEDFATMLAEAA